MIFPRFPIAENHKGVVMVAGRAPRGGDSLNGVDQGTALHLAFHTVPPVEVDQIPLPVGNIQTERGGFVQLDRFRAAVDNLRRPRDHVPFLKDAVIQPYL